jgi:hypothetical protein
LSSGFAIHALAIEQSARPGEPNTMADPCAFKTNFQNSLDNFEARFEGNGKTRVFIYGAEQTPGLHFSASVREYSYEQTV